MPMNVTSTICASLAQQQVICLATVVASGDQRLPVGRKAIIRPDGRMEDPFGIPDFDKALRGQAMQALQERECALVEVAAGISVFLDCLVPDAKLLICGAGHIAMPLARFAREVGFSVTVLDDREDFAHASRFPGCRVMAEDYTPALRRLALGPATYAVVITRGHEHDLDCLMEILPKETAYVGLIGSRRRIGFVLEELARKGIAKERCAELFTPIGLPIGAESPGEIALAITAELVCVRRKRSALTRTLRATTGVA